MAGLILKPFFLLYVYDFPERCPRCDTLLYRGIVEWVNQGESKIKLMCQKCGKEFDGISALIFAGE